MDTIIVPKIPKKFNCEKCNYECSNKKDFKKHLLTRKHVKNDDGVTSGNKTPQKIPKFECECGNTYKYRQGLYKHKKNCFIAQGKDISNINKSPSTDIDIDKELLIKMLLKNQDIMEGVILKNSDVMEKMIEMMPQMGMNHSNNTNTNSLNTNNFNIQMFLNDHCKNAMNLSDFIQSLPITSETYDSTIENGLTKTITSMMVNGLNDLDILERPIHCTDASRKTLYVKDSDIWEKDNELLHILKGINALSSKQRTLINKWKEVNKNWNTDENLQSRLTNLVCNSMKHIESDEKETGKIIRSISKNVYLDNDTKRLYA
jgi:hypothetical protein